MRLRSIFPQPSEGKVKEERKEKRKKRVWESVKTTKYLRKDIPGLEGVLPGVGKTKESTKDASDALGLLATAAGASGIGATGAVRALIANDVDRERAKLGNTDTIKKRNMREWIASHTDEKQNRKLNKNKNRTKQNPTPQK